LDGSNEAGHGQETLAYFGVIPHEEDLVNSRTQNNRYVSFVKYF